MKSRTGRHRGRDRLRGRVETLSSLRSRTQCTVGWTTSAGRGEGDPQAIKTHTIARHGRLESGPGGVGALLTLKRLGMSSSSLWSPPWPTNDNGGKPGEIDCEGWEMSCGATQAQVGVCSKQPTDIVTHDTVPFFASLLPDIAMPRRIRRWRNRLCSS